MRKILIITDTCSDIPSTIKLEHTKVLPLSFYFLGDKERIYKDLKIYSNRDYYRRLNCGVKSEMLPIDFDETVNTMADAAANGYDIICIHVSKNVSFGSYEILKSARDIAQLNDIDMRIAIIDSESMSMGEGLLVYKADQMISEGYSFDDIVAYLNKYKKLYTLDFYFTNGYDDKQSKVIKASKFDINKLLNLKNIYSMNSMGVYVKKRIPTWVNSSGVLVSNMVDRVDIKEPVAIMHTNNLRGAEGLAEYIEEIGVNAYIAEIDKVNGSILGPHVLGLAYKKK